MGEWHRPYEVNRLGLLVPGFLFLAVVFCCGGAPFAIGIPPNSWRVLLNPVFDLFVAAVLVSVWVGARSGVFVGADGVMVRVGFRRIVVPWWEVAYAEVAEVPKFPVIWQRGPSLGLVLVASTGQRRPLPVRLAAFTLRWGRGGPPYIVLTADSMNQVVRRINDRAARQRRHDWPPLGPWPYPPR